MPINEADHLYIASLICILYIPETMAHNTSRQPSVWVPITAAISNKKMHYHIEIKKPYKPEKFIFIYPFTHNFDQKILVLSWSKPFNYALFGEDLTKTLVSQKLVKS